MSRAIASSAVLSAKVALVCGCGRVNFEAEPRCLPVGSSAFGPPIAIESLSAPGFDIQPSLSGDRLTLYFSSDRGGDLDIYVATRSDREALFEAPAPLVDVNSAANEASFTTSQDGLTAVLASDRAGTMDLYLAQRANLDQPWGALQPIDAVNSAGDEYDPAISGDKLRLVFAARLSTNDDLFAAERPSADAAFLPPRPLTELNDGTTHDGNPSLSEDELAIVFNSARTAQSLLYWATRPSLGLPFSPPVQVPGTDVAEEPHLSADGCELFMSVRVAPSDLELHHAWLEPSS